MAANLIRGKKVTDAKLLLSFAGKQSAGPLLKTLLSAVASAKHNFDAEEANLYVSHVAVNEGPKLKRFRARARGSAYEIQKKTSHVQVVVDEIEQGRSPGRSTTPRKEGLGARAREQQAVVSRPKFRPQQEEATRPKEQRGLQRIFRRKSI